MHAWYRAWPRVFLEQFHGHLGGHGFGHSVHLGGRNVFNAIHSFGKRKTKRLEASPGLTLGKVLALKTRSISLEIVR